VNEKWLRGGCPLHAAPERWLDNCPLGPETDIYSVGVLFWYMLTLGYPFQGETQALTGLAHCRSQLPIEKLRERKVPPKIIEVISLMLARTPEKRFHSVNELKLALQDAITKSQ
jgi:serine/threonine-protein kinase